MCLAQEHNAVTSVRFKPAAPQSRVKHSTTSRMNTVDWAGGNLDAKVLNHMLKEVH